MTDAPWWAEEGLAFECTACGKCCRNHGEGYEYVYATLKERTAVARRLGISVRAFQEEYCERVAGGYSFRSEGDACVFLEDGRCSIYEDRPAQCRTFPFWPELLADRDVWEADVASFCPGVGRGPVRSREEIEAAMREAGP